MTQAADLAFAPEEEAAILRHMNGDHGADALVMCQGLGGVANATAAITTGIDKAGIEFSATVDEVPEAVRIPWGRELAARAEVRTEVVRLYRESCAVLGIEPREEAPE
jgi:putative heme iron utilization protein